MILTVTSMIGAVTVSLLKESSAHGGLVTYPAVQTEAARAISKGICDIGVKAIRAFPKKRELTLGEQGKYTWDKS